jgi:hypothetical protein
MSLPSHQLTPFRHAWQLATLVVLGAACGSSSTAPGGGDAGSGGDSATGRDGSSGHMGHDGGVHDAAPNDTGHFDARSSGDGGHRSDGGDAGHVSNDSGTGLVDASGEGGNGASCGTTLTPVDVSSPTTVVGTGTAASCTETALKSAIAAGGIITFNCGSAAATIPITATLVLRIDTATTLDGGGLVTLDGGNTTQLFTFTGTNFQVTTTTVTFQHMHFTHARATGSNPFPPTDAGATCSTGFQVGGGGVIQIRDGILHVIDSIFEQNHGAVPGPDIAGGAIYGIGSLGIVVVGSQFIDNDASNGGAIGSLFSDLTVMTSTFTGNKALGFGANADNATCPVVGGQRETGSGGNGGAIVMDGGETFTVKMCGDTFSNNVAGMGALGGALFRTPDGAQQETDIDQCTFDGNSAPSGGAMYFHNSHLVITGSTLSNNTAGGSGAIQADGTILDLTNVTLYGNKATTSPGGTISLFGNSGTFTNVTFAKNECNGTPGQSFGVDLFGGTTLTVNNTIFDSASQNDPNSPMACQGTNSGAHDFQWPKDHSVGSNPDTACVTGIDFADPLLGVLSSNGGPTQTALPGAGSPVIGVGAACPSTDQRGNARPASGCTAGAVEVN